MAFSPSGRPMVESIAFLRRTKGCTGSTWREASGANSAHSLESARGGTWGATGAIIFATSNPATLHARAVARWKADTDLSYQEQRIIWRPVSWPSFLPDGRTLLVLGAHETMSAVAFTSRQSDRSRKMKAEGCYRAIHRRSIVEPGFSAVWSRHAALPAAVRCGDANSRQETPSPSSIACALRLSGRQSSQLRIPDSWRTGQGWMRRTSSRGWIGRASLEARLDHRDDIGPQRCPRTVSDSSIPTLPTAI